MPCRSATRDVPLQHSVVLLPAAVTAPAAGGGAAALRLLLCAQRLLLQRLRPRLLLLGCRREPVPAVVQPVVELLRVDELLQGTGRSTGTSAASVLLSVHADCRRTVMAQIGLNADVITAATLLAVVRCCTLTWEEARAVRNSSLCSSSRKNSACGYLRGQHQQPVRHPREHAHACLSTEPHSRRPGHCCAHMMYAAYSGRSQYCRYSKNLTSAGSLSCSDCASPAPCGKISLIAGYQCEGGDAVLQVRLSDASQQRPHSSGSPGSLGTGRIPCDDKFQRGKYCAEGQESLAGALPHRCGKRH